MPLPAKAQQRPYRARAALVVLGQQVKQGQAVWAEPTLELVASRLRPGPGVRADLAKRGPVDLKQGLAARRSSSKMLARMQRSTHPLMQLKTRQNA